jgi:hypothetical protein
LWLIFRSVLVGVGLVAVMFIATDGRALDALQDGSAMEALRDECLVRDARTLKSAMLALVSIILDEVDEAPAGVIPAPYSGSI